MRTEHEVHVDDSRSLESLEDDTVELVVTSPPYPMIEMWDSIFGELNSDISTLLDAGDGSGAFELMHEELDQTWREVSRVLVDGGIACINVGDATRTIDGGFRVYQNHARIIDAFEALGFVPLPDILWRKPVNSAAKFMGSGMLPPNAYATLEHEYILMFRNGHAQRPFEPKSEPRYNAAYFWEERNTWFSDLWTGINGTLQTLDNTEPRARSAAFPFEIPYRLINMYSVYGDTVLDPFWGTGTTSLAAMVAARDSVGYELDEAFVTVFDERVANIQSLSRDIVHDRMTRHQRFVEEREEQREPPGYTAAHYDIPVMTKQETQILFYVADALNPRENRYIVDHSEYQGGTDPAATYAAQSTLAGRTLDE